MTCKHVVAEDYLFCPHCGEKQTRIICQCLNVNPTYASYCTQCGKDLVAEINQTDQHNLPGVTNAYNLDQLVSQAQAEPSFRGSIGNSKLSQEEINSMFKRKVKTHDDKK